jgi:hypothetical protein
MKKLLVGSFVALALGVLAWGLVQTAAGKAPAPTASLMPDHALLYIEAPDFRALLNSWNSSEEKRAWIKGDDYAEFSRSRLFERLSQAQTEFSTAASVPADSGLLTTVSGSQTALAVYDIGNLEFAYITRMDQPHAEATPLWQVRGKFELRMEGAAQFYVRTDSDSHRTAAFAVRDGWLILATREDLVAQILDRLQGVASHSLADEPWYADTLQQADKQNTPDLRMVLNLEKIVPSPYFRSYWVQRNITEMKQYRAALCDMRRSAENDREERILLRKTGIAATATGNVRPLLALAPADAVFSSAQATPDVEHVLQSLRENVLELKPDAQDTRETEAPQAASAENAGTSGMLEVRIDVEPAIAHEADPYEPLRALLKNTQPQGLLTVYETHTLPEQMFVTIDRAVVLESSHAWDGNAVEEAISAALRPGLTTSRLGIEWTRQAGTAGEVATLSGKVPLYLAAHGNRLYLATSEPLITAMLARQNNSSTAQDAEITYGAVFEHTATERANFQKLASKLDTAQHSTPSADAYTDGGNGQSPAFFSGNLESLSRMFEQMDRETVEEQDQGARVIQAVVYRWQKK